MGADWYFLATDQLGDSRHLSVAVTGGTTTSVCSDASRDGASSLDLAAVDVIWNRRRIFADAPPGSADPVRDQYVREQRTALLEGALADLDVRWVNSPAALAAARPKLLQLAAATRAGLHIPDTLATDVPAQVRSFAIKHSETGVITKVITPGTPLVAAGTEQYMVFTQRIDLDATTDAQISAAPALYQEEVSKAYEARAIVVGDRMLVCRIDSQASEQTSLDWRHYDFSRVEHRPISAPPAVEAGLLALCRQFGLVFAAIDLAVTPDGRWVFLELNPNGQWGWLEEYGGLPVSRLIAEELARQ